jgi:hypothetical protein
MNIAINAALDEFTACDKLTRDIAAARTGCILHFTPDSFGSHPRWRNVVIWPRSASGSDFPLILSARPRGRGAADSHSRSPFRAAFHA